MKINHSRLMLILAWSVIAGSFIIMYLESHRMQHRMQNRAEELNRSMGKLDEDLKQIDKQVHDQALKLDSLADASIVPIIDASEVEKEIHLLSEDMEMLREDAGAHMFARHLAQ